jgi:hypothetical protein
MQPYYTSRIQLHPNVIRDIFASITPTTKMLVFGLGYDSRMWYEGTGGNTFFVENKDEYIRLNEKDIPASHIVKYDYTTRCQTSMTMNEEEIQSFSIPAKILELAPFDIILIDGPEGWQASSPGRLLPCYWSLRLSRPGTLVYIDDSSRRLETYCIQKFYGSYAQTVFPERSGCTKIIL